MVEYTSEVRRDDLTKQPGDDVQAFSFTVDGVKYTIDASLRTREMIRHSLIPFMAVAHHREVLESGLDPGIIRDWARAHGYNVQERGRIPSKVIEAYHRCVK